MRIAIIFCCLALGHLTYADTPAGQLTRVKGLAESRGIGDEALLRLQPGASLHVGQTLLTASDAGAQVILSDGAVILIFSDSQVQINQYGFNTDTNRRTAILRVLKGRVRCVVSQKRSPDSWFVVETDQAAISVGRCDFMVSASPAETQVINMGFAVAVRNRSKLIIGDIALNTFQQTIIKENRPPDRPAIVTPEQRSMYQKNAEYLFP